jgi:hypothetical protein
VTQFLIANGTAHTTIVVLMLMLMLRNPRDNLKFALAIPAVVLISTVCGLVNVVAFLSVVDR